MPWPKGKPRSEETKKKIAATNSLLRHTQATKDKMSAAKLGKPRTQEEKRKISEGRIAMLATLSEEERRALSASYGHAGKRHSEETKAVIRAKTTERRQWEKAINAASPSRPELLVAAALGKLDIEFKAQHKLGYWTVDFYLPTFNKVIEVNGCYWHSCSVCKLTGPAKGPAQDARKAGYLKKNNYPLLVIWEHDVNAGKTVDLIRQFTSAS